MGIAMLAAARLVQVVPVWVDGWKPLKPRQMADRASTPLDNPVDAAWPGVATVARNLLGRLMRRHPRAGAQLPSCKVDRTMHPRPLRVVRILEPQQPRAAAGRMVISGRMADVCAELDRLAAAEAASQP